MIRIKLHPILVTTPTPLTVSIVGEVITVDGQEFDLSPLPEGGRLPGSAISTQFTGSAKRKDGDLYIEMLLPYVYGLTRDVTFPADIVVDSDGDVAIPIDHAPVVKNPMVEPEPTTPTEPTE